MEERRDHGRGGLRQMSRVVLRLCARHRGFRAPRLGAKHQASDITTLHQPYTVQRMWVCADTAQMSCVPVINRFDKQIEYQTEQQTARRGRRCRANGDAGIEYCFNFLSALSRACRFGPFLLIV
jgi:hypothetical protein